MSYSDWSRACALLGEPSLPEHAFGGRAWVRGMPVTYEDSGSSAPPPDPKLIAAQIRGIDTQNELIGMIMSQSERMAPLQEQQMRQAINAQDLAQKQSLEDRNWMLTRRGALSGLQDSLIDEANAFDTDARREQLAGEAMGDVNQAFSNTRDQALRSMSRMGVNPNDGRFASTQNQLQAQQALALATAANKTREAARQEGFNMKSQVMNALAGYPAMGMQATGAAAGYGLQGMTAAAQGLQGMNSGYAQALQGAANMTGSASGAMNAQTQAYTAAQGDDPTGSIIGAVGGIAVAF